MKVGDLKVNLCCMQMMQSIAPSECVLQALVTTLKEGCDNNRFRHMLCADTEAVIRRRSVGIIEEE